MLIEFLWNFIQVFEFFRMKRCYSQEKFLFLGKPEISLKNRLFGVGKKFVPLMQGFPNSGKGWEGGELNSPQWGRENRRFYWGTFFTGSKEPEDEWFWWFEPFLKLKTAFCEYWTSIKIKINMTCLSKEYEIQAMEQEQCLQL